MLVTADERSLSCVSRLYDHFVVKHLVSVSQLNLPSFQGL